MKLLLAAALVLAAFAIAAPAQAAPPGPTCIRECDWPPCLGPRSCTLPDPLECRTYGCKIPDFP